jgi:hypothetical protein
MEKKVAETDMKLKELVVASSEREMKGRAKATLTSKIHKGVARERAKSKDVSGAKSKELSGTSKAKKNSNRRTSQSDAQSQNPQNRRGDRKRSECKAESI